jgi:site-specific recombinase XerD
LKKKQDFDYMTENVRSIQELLGYKNVESIMIYSHVLNQGGRGVTSPVDF